MKDQFKGDGIVLDNALAFWVHRVYQVVRNETYRAFRDAGTELTPEQWVVLVRLWEQDGRTQNDLCDSTFRDRPTMSRMVLLSSTLRILVGIGFNQSSLR